MSLTALEAGGDRHDKSLQEHSDKPSGRGAGSRPSLAPASCIIFGRPPLPVTTRHLIFSISIGTCGSEWTEALEGKSCRCCIRSTHLDRSRFGIALSCLR
jgi:hypothetical protein